jgi:hypothetical protein
MGRELGKEAMALLFNADSNRTPRALHKLLNQKRHENKNLDRLRSPHDQSHSFTYQCSYERHSMNQALLIGIAILAGSFLGWHIRKLIERQQQLEKQVAELKDIADRRRLPYPAQAGIEDAIAIALDIINEQEAVHAYTDTRINQLTERLRQVRSTPQSYDTNQPDKRKNETRK